VLYLNCMYLVAFEIHSILSKKVNNDTWRNYLRDTVGGEIENNVSSDGFFGVTRILCQISPLLGGNRRTYILQRHTCTVCSNSSRLDGGSSR
jgi:hypothetical protein